MKRPDEKELRDYNVFYKPDTDFASHARLLQSKWRVSKGLKMNNKAKSNYGNFVDSDIAKADKVNFITDNIKLLVTEKIKEIRANGGLVSEPRIWNNLLSSQPLCFNLFGELHYDLDLATKFFQKLFPDKVSKVTKVDFEFSSRRHNPDNSAFDVYVEYMHNDKKYFFGIEVKYQENLYEETKETAAKNFSKHKDRYIQLTNSSNFFKPNTIEQLQLTPIAQMWRDHLLSFNMTDENISGSFIFLYPFDNVECNEGVLSYQKLLISDNEEQTKFYPRDLAKFIRTLYEIHKTKWTQQLVERYLGE
jgi:hypothetical protein